MNKSVSLAEMSAALEGEGPSPCRRGQHLLVVVLQGVPERMT